MNATKSLSALIGLSLAAGFAATAVNANPFGSTELASGYNLAAAGDENKKPEGKCGEGKCGANKAGHKDGKTAHEGKCGEGKCGANMAQTAHEGKCGEGKCGANKAAKQESKAEDKQAAAEPRA